MWSQLLLLLLLLETLRKPITITITSQTITIIIPITFRLLIQLLLLYRTSKSIRALVADTGTKSCGKESWEVTVFIQK